MEDGDAKVANVTVAVLLHFSVANLQDFIHARMFDGKTFQKAKLVGSDGKLNKIRYKTQTAESIENDCSSSESCMVYLAWKLRSTALVLKRQEIPVLDTTLMTPTFSIVHACPESVVKASEYLSNAAWIESFAAVVKGVSPIVPTEELKTNADKLVSAMET